MPEQHIANTRILIDWARTVLCEDIQSIDDVAVTAYSHVLRLRTKQNIYYLKKTPSKLYVEARILGLLHDQCGVRNIPQIIARNDDLHCFLMLSCGGHTLREVFDGVFDDAMFAKGQAAYVDIQKASSDAVQMFLDIGVPDWRIKNLPHIYAAFVNDTARLSAWHLNEEEQLRLKRSQNLFPRLCETLASLRLPDVLNHSDFHPNAMVLNRQTSQINIIDIGEATIGHPLLPLAGCVTHYLDHRYHLRSDQKHYRKMKTAVLKAWDIVDQEFEDVIDIIGPLNYAMTFRELMKMTDQDFPKWSKWMKPVFFEYLDLLEEKYG